jgi:hypothetical protein
MVERVTKSSAPKRRRLESREDTVATSLIIPRPLHRRALMAGVGLNWTFGEVVRTALREWLDRYEGAAKKGNR